MLKFQLIYLTLCSLTQAAYYSRMATVNRLRVPTAFRPGVTFQRPWTHQRLMPAASHRVPYVVYRNAPQRYAMKHFAPGPTRTVFSHGWKTTARLPPLSPSTPEYEFVRAASSPPAVHDGGAIHTIPAPNLSLSEKPIVVVDSDNLLKSSQDGHRPTYEVTEKFLEPGVYQVSPKVEIPVGFSKPSSPSSNGVQNLFTNNAAALQFASDYGLSVSLPQTSVVQPHQIVPPQFNMQGFPSHQDIVNAGSEGIVISPQMLYQADPSFLQKLQEQLMQRYPSVEFIPYPADTPSNNIQQFHHQPHIQQQPQNNLFLLENEEITKQTPTSFEPQKSVVQRETHESAVMSLIPHSFTQNNTTEKHVEVTSASQPHNVTVELVTAESKPSTTTVKYIIESTTQEQNVTPIYYAQVGQSIGNIIANGFYSAINDVRAAAALAQVEKPQEQQENATTTTTTTAAPELMAYFVQPPEGFKNHTEVKPHIGVPFTKTADSVNIAYTLLRANNKESQVTKEGNVYAGQIVEATISEDQDFNKQKATLIQRRAPLRIIAVTEKKQDQVTSTSVPPKITVVKAKIPPKSKLTFDDKTGEPVLRIYASYVDPSKSKELLASKLNNIKNVKEIVVKKPDGVENWTSAMVRKADKTQGHDANQVTDFGLKLRSRSDDYIPLFEEYEE
ncbi:uncharacterized protein LOC135073726 isoform X2 [Ostrinia nubilalis]|uniref:uncharacterized protein LOC135073726 isoform X2 n=1 Tax=Ostrinia nubilalis TaxID=29057 RepID=UPI0030822AEE